MSTFVSVGNAKHDFHRLIEGVIDIADMLSHPIVIQHGNTSVVTSEKDCIWIDFMSMEEFTLRISESEMIILHAGAGSWIHALQAGKVPVVMPRRVIYGEHIDDHQLELATVLGQERKIVVAMEPANLESAVSEAKELQSVSGNGAKNEVPRILAMVKDALLG